MGYFSEKDIINDESYRDREDVSGYVIEQMIKVIMQAFPEETYNELIELEESSLRGLYGQAKRKLKSISAGITIDEDDYGIDEYEDYQRS